MISPKLRGGLAMLISLGVQALIPLLAMPVALRNLQQADYGKFQFSLAVLGWLAIVTAPAMVTGATSAMARGKGGTLWTITKARLWISLALSVLVIPVALWIYQSDEALGALLLLLAPGLLTVPIMHVASVYYTAREQFTALAFWNALAVTPSIGLAIGSLSGDMVVAAAGYYAVKALAALAGAAFILLYSLTWSEKSDPRAISYGLKNLPADLLVATKKQAGPVLIASLAGFEALTTFAIAYGLINKLLDTTRLFTSLWLADFSMKSALQAQVWVRQRWLKIAAIGFAITLAFNGLAFVYVRLLPPVYADAWLYALVLSLAFPAALLYQAILLIPASHLQARKQAIAQSAFCLTEIAAIAILGWGFGAWGICAAIVVARWVSLPVARFVVRQRAL